MKTLADIEKNGIELNSIYNADCLEVMKKMLDNSVDAIVTDPPAGISFMGKEWDSNKGGRDEWIKWLTSVMQEGLRVLKPGGHTLVWALPRTSHWTATALENAGFEIRDCVYHLFGSGFPKSLDISKAIDKQGEGRFEGFIEMLKEHRKKKKYSIAKVAELGGFYGEVNHGGAVTNWEKGYNMPTVEQYNKLIEILEIPLEKAEKVKREIIGQNNFGASSIYGSETYNNRKEGKMIDITIPKTPEAKQWEGYGTALKPAVECWWLCRKPISESTIAENVLKWGVGGLNIDGTRVGYQSERDKLEGQSARPSLTKDTMFPIGGYDRSERSEIKGRFPANLIHDGSDVVLAEFPNSKAGVNKPEKGTGGIFNKGSNLPIGYEYGDEGSAARFFYSAKPSSIERNWLRGDFEEVKVNDGRNTPIDNAFQRGETKRLNSHPTVKSQALMQYLIKLITPPKGIVLDCFAGSGSTLVAAQTLGHPFIGIEIDKEYCKIAEGRIRAIPPTLF